jgi:hypothetical protein
MQTNLQGEKWSHQIAAECSFRKSLSDWLCITLNIFGILLLWVPNHGIFSENPKCFLESLGNLTSTFYWASFQHFVTFWSFASLGHSQEFKNQRTESCILSHGFFNSQSRLDIRLLVFFSCRTGLRLFGGILQIWCWKLRIPIFSFLSLAFSSNSNGSVEHDRLCFCSSSSQQFLGVCAALDGCTILNDLKAA